MHQCSDGLNEEVGRLQLRNSSGRGAAAAAAVAGTVRLWIVNTVIAVQVKGAMFSAVFVNQKALCQDRDETTLREDDSTLSVIRKRNVLSVYTHQDCLLTIVSDTPPRSLLSVLRSSLTLTPYPDRDARILTSFHMIHRGATSSLLVHCCHYRRPSHFDI